MLGQPKTVSGMRDNSNQTRVSSVCWRDKTITNETVRWAMRRKGDKDEDEDTNKNQTE